MTDLRLGTYQGFSEDISRCSILNKVGIKTQHDILNTYISRETNIISYPPYDFKYQTFAICYRLPALHRPGRHEGDGTGR